MQLKTKHFGEVEYALEDIILFEEGLPGFRDATQFVLLADKPEDLFHWLQSIDDEELAFVLMDVKQIKTDYQPRIDPEVMESLEDGSPNAELVCYNIAIVPEDLQEMRVNLKAPIIINKSSRKGKQVIASNEEYGIRHYIFKEIQELPISIGIGR